MKRNLAAAAPVFGALLAGFAVTGAGCTILAGIHDGVLGGDASVDGGLEAEAEAEAPPPPDSGPADSHTPPPTTLHIGAPCSSASSCPGGICLPAGVCSAPCADAGACPATWTCDADDAGVKVCTCTKTNGGVEVCDGKDNDCDGVVDNGATAVCVASGGGSFSTCIELDGGGAACECPKTGTACGSDPCVDLQSDGKNCGRCGRDCQYPGGGGCSAGQCSAFAFVDSTAFDAGGAQRIAGVAADAKYVYFSYSSSSAAGFTSILHCPADAPGACASPETFVAGLDGGAGYLSLDPSSGALAGTTGVAGGKAGVAYMVGPPPDGSAPSAVIAGAALQNENYFGSGVTNGVDVAWIDLEKLGIDMANLAYPGDAGYENPTATVPGGSPTVLLAWPAHSALYIGVKTANGGQIYVCPMPGCSGTEPSPVLNGNNYIGAPNGLAFDGTNVYIAASGINGQPGNIWTFARNQTFTTSMATAQNPTQLTLDSNGHVYWIDSANPSAISWCSTTGCPSPPALPNAISIAAAPANAGTSVLVTDGVSLYWNASTPSGGMVIERVALP
jgi:hypothetical protein